MAIALFFLHELNNPLRLIVKTVALLAMSAVILHGAYQQGVQHAAQQHQRRQVEPHIRNAVAAENSGPQLRQEKHASA